MDDDRIERLLAGYRLPDVSAELDRRVLDDGAAALAPARSHVAVADLGRTVLERLGFGYLAWLFDLVTTTDAEYRVVFF